MTTSRSTLRVAVAHLAYQLLLGLTCLLALLPWLVRAWRDPLQWRWARQRLWGRLPEGIPGGRPIWIHAVSVGEVKAARPLVASLRREAAGVPIVLSTGTATGYEAALRSLPEVYVCHAPIDMDWVVRKVVRRLDPRLIVLLELEVWPTFMRVADELGVPQVILNGRITESSWRTYRKLRWWLPEYDRLAFVAAQDQANRERFAGLGIVPERLAITGSLKHDLVEAPDPEAAASLGRELGLNLQAGRGLPVFLAGSTHDGEDQLVVEAWLAAGGPATAHMLLVPRHLERLKDIQKLLKRMGVAWELRSQAGAKRSSETLLLVDSMGELEILFALADVVFLGGSLVPVGGHNVLEPAAAGRPVLVGPHLESCRGEAELLRAVEALVVVDDPGAFAEQLQAWLEDPAECIRRGRAGSEAARGLRGAAAADVAALQQRGLLASG